MISIRKKKNLKYLFISSMPDFLIDISPFPKVLINAVRSQIWAAWRVNLGLFQAHCDAIDNI